MQCLLLVLVILASLGQVYAEPTNAISATPAAQPLSVTNRSSLIRLYAYVVNFSWEEYVGDSQVVDEEGFLAGAGVAFHHSLSTKNTLPLHLFGDADFFFGETDYAGGVQNPDGSSEPFSSDTTYVGLRGQLALGSPIKLKSSTHIMPHAGVGTRIWLRTLDTDLSDDDVGTYGYEESWGTLYGVLGARLAHNVDATHALFIAAQANLPIWNEMIADLSNVGGPDESTLDPKRETGWQAEGGLETGRFCVSIFFAAQDFGQSPINDDDLFQPESRSRILGARAAIAL